MQKKMTISLNEVVYDELCRVVGKGNISNFIESLITPQLKNLKTYDLDAAYKAMSNDYIREQEALEWSNAVIGDISDETR